MSALRQLALLFVLASLASTVTAETAFTYQGRLSAAGAPAQGSYDFQFRLYNAETGGTAVGSMQSAAAVAVSGGVFSVLLDFGDGPFNSAPRWLQIEVREAGAGGYSVLAPRQRVGASPFAIETMFVAPGAVDTAALQDDAVTQAKLADNSVGTSQIQNNSVSSTDIRDGAVSSIDIRDATISTADLAAGIYRTKADLYESVGSTMTIGIAPQSGTAVCQDPNDLPLTGGCRMVGIGQTEFLATSVDVSGWSSDTQTAAIECHANNTHPSNPGSNPIDVTPYIVCVAVP